MKIAIAGVPKAGKTTLANFQSRKIFVFHTDDLIGQNNTWSEISEKVADWFNTSGAFIIEGAAVPRALRKWLAKTPTGKPCDQLIWMGKPFQELDKNQMRMAKGCLTIIEEIEEELIKRGVQIVQR